MWNNKPRLYLSRELPKTGVLIISVLLPVALTPLAHNNPCNLGFMYADWAIESGDRLKEHVSTGTYHDSCSA
jgi:hypothetical protein